MTGPDQKQDVVIFGVSAARAALWLALAALAACDHAGPPRSAAARDAGHDARSAHPMLPQPDRMQSEPDLDASAAGSAASMLDATLDPSAVLRMRGEYLVRHVAGCNECHTPRLPSGAPDESKLLSGVEKLIDLEPDDDSRGMLHSRNLTPDEESGLGRWSDAQIKKAFQQGLDDEGKVLHWMMPYWIFRNMEPMDADAIVAFLRALPPLAHAVPENQPTKFDDKHPYELPSTEIPPTTLDSSHPDFESATRGRYLASAVAPCMLCHSPLDSDPSAPIDATRMFSGKRRMVPARLGTVFDKHAPQIDSFNLTPHANGIGGWSATDVATALRQGVGRDSLPVCDPMPSSYGGSFLGMTQADALDLGHYFTTLPPKDSGVIARCCTACHGNQGVDAGL